MRPSSSPIPLLKIFWPLIGGIIFSRYILIKDTTPLLISAFLILGLALYVHHQAISKIKISPRVLLLFAAFFLSWAYAIFRENKNEERTWAPIREAYLDVRIDKVFDAPHSKQKQLQALATITATAPHLRYLIHQRIALSLKTDDEIPTAGAHGKVHGLLIPIHENYKEAMHSFQRYLQALGIHYQLRRGRWIEKTQEASKKAHFYHETAQKLESILHLNSKNSSATNIYIAMLLGKIATLSPEQKWAFSKSGTLHLFAISGLHIAVISAFLFQLFRHLRLPPLILSCLVLISIFLYVEITGGSPSARRAFLMVAFMLGGLAFKRKASALAGLVAAAVITLLWEPKWLFHIGFQLSYSVVSAILLYGIPLGKWLNQRYRLWAFLPEKIRQLPPRSWIIRLWRSLLSASSLSLAASLMSAPLIMSTFNLYSPIGIILNILIIPIASLVIVLGFSSLCFGLIGLKLLSESINPFAEAILCFLQKIVETSLSLPFSYFDCSLLSSQTGPLIALFLIGYGFYRKPLHVFLRKKLSFFKIK